MPDVNDLCLLIRSNTPIIVLETHDETRALEVLTRVAMQQNLGFYSWTITDGLKRWGIDNNAASFTLESAEELEARVQRHHRDDNKTGDNPATVLQRIKTLKPAAVIALCDFHPYLPNNPEHVRLLKDIALRYETLGHTVILLSHALDIPAELQRLSVRYQLRLPDDAQLMTIVRDEIQQWQNDHQGQKLPSETGAVKKLLRNLRGLGHRDARRLARQAIRNDGAITEADLPLVNRAKFQLMDMDGVIAFEHNTESFAAVGGLKKLKDWIKKREQAWLRPQAASNDRPRGVMLLGVQGGGKSLAARAIAGLWSLPLLRLDMGALYNKFIGETEKNLRDALALADIMAPCVIWMDEIEKGLATGTNDDSTTRRVLGTLLTWMAENKHQVFVVATANDVSSLPPELMRKGRLDEIFFVDLPDEKTRAEIFAIHLNKRNFKPEQFALHDLALHSNGFSGAEIEQAIVSAIYHCSAERKPLSNEAITQELENTYPLSILRSEEIAALREWAKDRTVMAD